MGSYDLEIFISPLLITFGLLTATFICGLLIGLALAFGLRIGLVLVFATFFLALTVLGIFQFEFEGVYSAK